MKKLYSILIFFLLPIFSFSQNGGISSENASLKLEFIGHSGSMVVVKTTNKLICSATIRVQWGPIQREKIIGPFLSDTFHLPVQTQRFIRAHSTSTCGGNSGNVEINYLTILPIKFEFFMVKQVGKGVVNVQFKVSESENTEKFNIQISKDGKNFETISVIIPDKINPNKIYSINLKI